jgi:hypothetical protein
LHISTIRRLRDRAASSSTIGREEGGQSYPAHERDKFEMRRTAARFVRNFPALRVARIIGDFLRQRITFVRAVPFRRNSRLPLVSALFGFRGADQTETLPARLDHGRVTTVSCSKVE